jgi:thiosulfate dehydrogenase
MKSWRVAILLCTFGIYLSVVVFGIHLARSKQSTPDIGSISGPNRDLVRRGLLIFNRTPQFAPQYARASLSCQSCHAEHGTELYAAPVTGVARRFPQFSARAGRMINLQDRIRECFVRSEAGNPPPDDSGVMRALIAYLNWMSPPSVPAKAPGTGLIQLPALRPDPERGAVLYQSNCLGCHGQKGEGGGLWPPLWGPYSFNRGAGMNRIPKLAAFIQHNMPQNRKGILTPQEAYDIASFIHQQERPPMNPAYAKY